MDKDSIIKKAKDGFNKDLLKENYPQIHHDDTHLELLLNLVNICDGCNYLDLGTGNGYVAFALTEISPTINVFGIDIADEAITNNNYLAAKNMIKNIEFDVYDGETFNYSTGFFRSIISRYAIHHFPDLDKTFNQLQTLLSNNGQLIISDPTPADLDQDHFLDAFMQLKDDGHVKFYNKKEMADIAGRHGFTLEKSIETTIRFPRPYDDRYQVLVDKTDQKIVDLYQIEIKEDQVFISIDVMNLVFRKR